MPKRPESVLVVIHTPQQVLLLQRRDGEGLWQSVTGSLEAEESPQEAAVRELAEETGLQVPLLGPVARNVYEIYPQWQHRYAPEVWHNREHVFYAPVPEPVPVVLSEHSAYRWVDRAQAEALVFSWSNQEAIANLIKNSE